MDFMPINIDRSKETQVCKQCKKEKHLACYTKTSNGTRGGKYFLKTCKECQKKGKQPRVAVGYVNRTFAVTPEILNALKKVPNQSVFVRDALGQALVKGGYMEL